MRQVFIGLVAFEPYQYEAANWLLRKLIETNPKISRLGHPSAAAGRLSTSLEAMHRDSYSKSTCKVEGIQQLMRELVMKRETSGVSTE